MNHQSDETFFIHLISNNSTTTKIHLPIFNGTIEKNRQLYLLSITVFNAMNKAIGNCSSPKKKQSSETAANQPNYIQIDGQWLSGEQIDAKPYKCVTVHWVAKLESLINCTLIVFGSAWCLWERCRYYTQFEFKLHLTWRKTHQNRNK